ISPFRELEFSTTEGGGLNPLLQDPWMVIHPPVMFLAFALAGIPFVLALAAMVRKDFSDWLKLSFPYVGLTSLALGVANVLGGYWAYKTLGWGGYWAWDPVENTSFIPWVMSLGLIHGMLIEKRSRSLRQSNLLLTALLFLLVIYGTFLTRSGVLADFSVHSFVDLGVNAVLIAFVLLFLGLTLGIFLFSWTRLRVGEPLNYNVYSRDFVLFIGMVLLFILGVVVLFWSSLPLVTKYLTSNPAAAEISTYNTFAFPLAILISLFLTISPFVRGPGYKSSAVRIRILLATAIALAVGGGLWNFELARAEIAVAVAVYLMAIVIYFGDRKITGRLGAALFSGIAAIAVSFILGVWQLDYLFFIGAAAASAAANIIVMAEYLPKNIHLAGGHLTHFGYGLMLVGILASSAFSTNEKLVLPRDRAGQAYGSEITYHGTLGTVMDADNEILLTLKSGGELVEARPQYFYARRLDGIMKRPYIRKNLLYDLYLSPQEIQDIPDSRGLMLKKGESEIIGEDFTVTFIDFEIGSHSDMSAMSVGARLEIEYKGEKESITPRLMVSPSGSAGDMSGEPVDLPGDSGYQIKLERVYADDGVVALSIPGLIEPGPVDRLILDISKKPGINLLWIGSIAVFIGLAMSILRRFTKS
ncbi:MAG: cytochrome c biogenesis protein CcsA, partial [Candidatus Zixiibacteriota bacterium]